MPSNARHVRFLVVGCGSIGKRHIRNLIAVGAERIIAVDTRADRRHEVKSKFGIETFDLLDAVWGRKPEVALITAPTSLHIPLALQTAEHGCHLFVEKPLSAELAGVNQLLEVVRQRKLITLVGCNLRFHPGLITVKKLLEEEAIGHVVSARLEVGQYLPDWHPEEDYRQGYSARRDLGGGVILDAIHEIDYIRWMLGDVQMVVCFAGKLSRLEIETEDTAAILLRFIDGAIGEIHLDYVQRAYSRTCHIVGDEGTIRWDYSAGEVRWYSAARGEWTVINDPSGWEPNQMYMDELQHFLACLAMEEEPVADVFEGFEVLKIALSAKRSSEWEEVFNLQE